MNRLVKGVALFVLIACVVWVLVLWRWQATSRDMSIEDIVLYLGLMPLTVFAVAIAGTWAWRGASGRAAERSVARAASATTARKSGVASGTDEAERHRAVQLLAAHVATAAGASPSELLSAAREGSPRPQLDTELRGDDGMPVLTARIADVDASRLEEEAAPHLIALRAAQAEWAQVEPDDTVWRALAALEQPLLSALDALLPWAELLTTPLKHGDEPAAERSVRVLLGWPLGWSEFEQALARAVATGWLTERGGAVLPGVRIAVNAQAIGGEELLLQADALMQTLARAHHDEPLIVAACHSSLGERALETMDRDGVLYDAQRRPKGRMPGEAAAALVLAGAAWPLADEADTPPPLLHRPALARRDKSIEAPGRVGAQRAQEVCAAALVAGTLDPAAVTALVSDADQHTDRAAECFIAATETLPQIDAATDVVVLGHVTGAVGGVAPLLVIACAAEQVRAKEAPCLALALGDPFQRLALLVRPRPPASGENGSPAAAPSSLPV